MTFNVLTPSTNLYTVFCTSNLNIGLISIHLTEYGAKKMLEEIEKEMPDEQFAIGGETLLW